MGIIPRNGAIFGASALLLGLSAQPVPAASEAVKIALPSPIISFSAEYIAEEKFYPGEGLDVTATVLPGISSINSVISGSMDFAFSTGSSLTRAAAKGQRLLAIATMSIEPGEFAVVRKDVAQAAHFDPKAPLAVRAQILRGHSFGIGGVGTIGDAYLRVFAKAGGVDPKDYVVSGLQPPDILAAMSRKSLDGFALGPPWAQQVVHDATGVVIGSGVDGDPPGYSPAASALLVTRPQLCAERRAVCEKIGRSMKRAAEFIHEHPAEAIAILKKRFPTIEDAVLADAYAVVIKTTPQPPVPTAEQLRNSDKINLDAGFIKQEDLLPSYDGLFTAEFAK
jgi:NitT/TauT family transport system substrate-binding protein